MLNEINAPVVINIWCRSDYQKKQFEVIKEVKPKILVLASDGGRNTEEMKMVLANRNFIEQSIDWPCEIGYVYQDKNIGIWEMLRKCEEYVWSRYDRCIYLEDDILPSKSFFYYCDELLEKYKDDLRVNVICGMNHFGQYECGGLDYFFSRQGSIWGFAMWKRTYEAINRKWAELTPYEIDLFRKRLSTDRFVYNWLNEYLEKQMTSGHRPGPEFFFMLGVYGENQLQIVPTKNLICCMNETKGGANSDRINRLPRKIRQIFNMKVYELDFPLKHPVTVIPDECYEKRRNRLMAYNHPLINIGRKIEHGLYAILEGDFKYIIKKIMK